MRGRFVGVLMTLQIFLHCTCFISYWTTLNFDVFISSPNVCKKLNSRSAGQYDLVKLNKKNKITDHDLKHQQSKPI